MMWTLRLEGRRQPFLEIPHTGTTSLVALEIALMGLRAAGLVVIVNFTRSKKQVTQCPITSSV